MTKTEIALLIAAVTGIFSVVLFIAIPAGLILPESLESVAKVEIPLVVVITICCVYANVRMAHGLDWGKHE